MRIDAVDFFYLSMPEVTLEGDGSQDALLVRVASGEQHRARLARQRLIGIKRAADERLLEPVRAELLERR